MVKMVNWLLSKHEALSSIPSNTHIHTCIHKHTHTHINPCSFISFILNIQTGKSNTHWQKLKQGLFLRGAHKLIIGRILIIDFWGARYTDVLKISPRVKAHVIYVYYGSIKKLMYLVPWYIRHLCNNTLEHKSIHMCVCIYFPIYIYIYIYIYI
jgi:hypothetical protein